MQNNAEAAVFSILPTSRSCENIRYFDQKYQPGNLRDNLQVSVLIINIYLLRLMNYG